jgi:hypothetical protein
LRAQAHFDITQAFAVGKLCERHAPILIDAGKGFDFVIAAVTLDTPPEGVHRQVLHHLRKNETVCVHKPRLPADQSG